MEILLARGETAIDSGITGVKGGFGVDSVVIVGVELGLRRLQVGDTVQEHARRVDGDVLVRMGSHG